MMNPTIKLIDLVKPHPCLYEKKDRNYKNGLDKDVLWEKISKALNQKSDETRNKWKNLKDCYTKHKKEVKLKSDQKRKYLNWPWAPYLTFLDSSLPQSQTTHNTLKPESDSSQDNEDMPEPVKYLDMTNPLDMPSRPESPHTPFSEPPTNSETPFTMQVQQPMNIMEKNSNYLKIEKKPDEVDLLFESYAVSFRKLKPRTQAQLKLRLAQIFSEAELKELDDERSSPSPPIHLF